MQNRNQEGRGSENLSKAAHDLRSGNERQKRQAAEIMGEAGGRDRSQSTQGRGGESQERGDQQGGRGREQGESRGRGSREDEE